MPIGEAIVESVLSKQIDDLEPTLTRHDYTANVLAEMLGTKQADIKAMFKKNLVLSEIDRGEDRRKGGRLRLAGQRQSKEPAGEYPNSFRRAGFSPWSRLRATARKRTGASNAARSTCFPQEPPASRKTGRASSTFAASRAFGEARKMANGKTLKKKSSI
jgi:hypothetical protein